MVEPFSLAGNVVQIISACATTIKTIHDLIKEYDDAPKKLESLASEAALVQVTLVNLDRLLRGKESFFAEKIRSDPDLSAAIDKTLTGCWSIFLLLDKELNNLRPKGRNTVSCLQRARLLFNDDVIQDYRSQIRGHIQGLDSVVICLQAQTVSDTHETLSKANETLEKLAKIAQEIADATIGIRKSHKEICFPESVYEGYTPFEEDKNMDEELLRSGPYRANVQRYNSLTSNDTTVIGISSQFTPFRKRPMVDLMSDMPLKEEDLTSNKTELLGTDVFEDLLKFPDEGDQSNGGGTSSAQLKELEDYCWGPSLSYLQEETIAKPPIKTAEKPKEFSGDLAHFEDSDKVVHSQARPTLARGLPHEFEDPLVDIENSLESYAIEERPTSRSVIDLPPHFDIPAMIQPKDQEGLIPLWTERPTTGPTSSNSSMSHFGSTSTACTGRTTITPPPAINDTTPISPGVSSLHSQCTLPADHRLGSSFPNAPRSDESQEKYLLDTMADCRASIDPTVRLNWAEDALRHCAVSIAHQKRLANMKVKKKASQPLLSKKENKLMAVAREILEDRQKADDGRAYFLAARYIVTPSERELQYRMAYSKGSHRSLFYLGQMFEKQEATGDTKKTFGDGAELGDAACLHRLARAHIYGQFGFKKDKKNKEKGICLLQQASKQADSNADKDHPDPLYDLALLHLEPPKPKLVSSSKPLVQQSIPQAIIYLRRAAFLGHAPSQLRLAELHHTGEADRKDSKPIGRKASISSSILKRRISYASASSAGTIDAEMGSTLEAEMDPRLANHYLHLAARRGLAEADYEIARRLMSDSASLSEQHAKLAYSHTRRAYLSGVAMACGLMGKALEEGIGCRKDEVQAEILYYAGGKKGDEAARKKSDALRNRGVGVDGKDAIYVRPNK